MWTRRYQIVEELAVSTLTSQCFGQGVAIKGHAKAVPVEALRGRFARGRGTGITLDHSAVFRTYGF